MKTLWVSMLSLGFLCGCSKPVTYKISWWNGDDLLATTNVKKGEMPEFEGADPTKTDSTGEFEYTFVGWTPEVVEAVEDASYSAEFEEKRVNWSKDERDEQVEKLGEAIPFFPAAEDAVWEWDETYECFSIEAGASVDDVTAALVKGGYVAAVYDDSDPDMVISELFKAGAETYLDVDVYGDAEVCYVDVYAPAELPTMEGLISAIANGMFGDPTAYQEDGAGGYWTAGSYKAANFDNDLAAFGEAIAYYMMPQGVYVVESRAATLSTGDQAYVVLGVTPNNLAVQLLAYASGTSFIGQFSVYEATAE